MLKQKVKQTLVLKLVMGLVLKFLKKIKGVWGKKKKQTCQRE